MKITKSKLKQIIKEELQNLEEAPGRYRSSGYYGRTDGDSGDPRYIRQKDYSEPTGPSKPARKIPQLPPEEKADDRLLNDASLFARILLPTVRFNRFNTHTFNPRNLIMAIQRCS